MLKNKTLRAFIALDIPSQTQSQLCLVQDLARDYLLGARWTKPLDLHLTLHFLGEISVEKASLLSESIDKVKNFPSFQLHFVRVGFFAKRAFWAGLAESAHFKQLFDRTANLLESQGFTVENRKLTPHVTLARLKNFTGSTDRAANIPLNIHWPVQSLSLYRSELTTSGSIYSRIRQVTLS